jgi:hypothetical protein
MELRELNKIGAAHTVASMAAAARSFLADYKRLCDSLQLFSWSTEDTLTCPLCRWTIMDA